MASNGWLSSAQHVVSPHYSARDLPHDIRLCVVHGISLPRDQFNTGLVHALFLGDFERLAASGLNELDGLKVSAHFFIQRNGQLNQFVSLFDQAWHAGNSSYLGEQACNQYSIGVELEGSDLQPYTAIQYHALAQLIQELEEVLRGVGQEEPLVVLGHQHIAPNRKTDPGPYFNWQTLARLLNRPLPDASAPTVA